MYINRTPIDERLKLIVKGENSIHDYVIEHVLRVPKHTNVYHYNDDDVTVTDEYLGDWKYRREGDTCRMLFTFRISDRENLDRPKDYYLWEGFVPTHLNYYGSEGEKRQNVGIMLKSAVQNKYHGVMVAFGIITGMITCRMVLMEKTKKAC